MNGKLIEICGRSVLIGTISAILLKLLIPYSEFGKGAVWMFITILLYLWAITPIIGDDKND